MDAISATALLSATAGAATTIATAWLRERGQRLRARERSHRIDLRDLPPNSRIVDLGRHGTVIDVGSRADRTGNADR
ncbi:MAG: hypothetical protein ACR2MP_12965 [Streptosporangiaceae bacterium]